MQRILNKETVSKIGEKVLVKGWVNRVRDIGQVVFIDLRDYSGLLQVVFEKDNLDNNSLKNLDSLSAEYIIAVQGKIKQRSGKQINKKMITGTVEMLAAKIEIISQCKSLPFEVDKNTAGINDELRIKHRYLDLRSPRMRDNMIFRNKLINFFRQYLADEEFIEIQTPILTKSTPEGARDFLVPSRLHPGKFFALPQSPQQYKQLLMVAGFEKYFQIAPCFRDEDPRADRSPGEFYQLDIEMSFVKQEDILKLIEKMFTSMIKTLMPDKKITSTPWPKLKYNDVIKKYGTDKPDLRKNKKDPDELAFAWVVDFPLFVQQSKEDFFHGAGEKYAPSHHMFTAPREEDLDLLDKQPMKARSYQHDLILNGFEVGGGSIRIHELEIQQKVFELIGFTSDQQAEFSHLLKAFEYGMPPHGGIAPGIDRLLMVLLSEPNVREVIPFPLIGDARDPLTGAPSQVSSEQLTELHIKLDLPKKSKKKNNL